MPHAKTIGKPDAGNPHVRFEGDLRKRSPSATTTCLPMKLQFSLATLLVCLTVLTVVAADCDSSQRHGDYLYSRCQPMPGATNKSSAHEEYKWEVTA